MLPGNKLFFPILKILFLLLLFNFNPTSSCTPSSCGHITQIRYPFRLKTNPTTCKHYNSPYFDLDCRNNQTFFTANSKRYSVEGINYRERTIRLVDPSIKRENLSSCPLYSNSEQDWSTPRFDMYLKILSPYHVAFIHCLSPVNSMKYMKASFCGDRSNIFSNTSSEYYILAGEILVVLDLEESCTVDKVALISANVSMKGNSLTSIYDNLADGFELSWYTELFVCATIGSNGIYGLSTFGELGCQLLYYLVVISERVSRLPLYGSIGILFRLQILKFVIGFTLLIWLVARQWRRRHLCMDKSIEEFLQGQCNLAPIKYTYSEIKKMTNNFTQKLGEGGYGIVYKGKLRSGPYVAIKLMEQSVATEEEFISEVRTIGQIHHVNVVRLIGYCVERSKCALVYEFLPNGSLDRYIFNQQSLGMVALTHEKMFEIALGVARGIEYLHHGCNMQILHFDIKPHNVLLNEKFNPKISDFGLAQLSNAGESSMSLISARGTVGYMAPEMFYRNMGSISYKADVYSYGMLLMEIASRRKNMNLFIEDESRMYFPSWAYEQLCLGKYIKIADATEEEKRMVKKMIIVALWCIQIRPSHRPTMNRVVEMLESDLELQIPPKPFIAPQEIATHEGITTSYNVDCISLDLVDK